MKNISKLLVGILFSALVMAPSYAGEMAVTGGATATYSIGGDTQGSGTVSYTHLRAHETPEHLVCRLLLEKKKI